MRLLVGMAALSGLAGAASGQTGLRVELNFDEPAFVVGERGVVSITAYFEGPAHSYFSSINIDLIPNVDAIRVDSVAPIAWNNPALGFTGTPALVDGGRIIGLQAAQFSLIPPYYPTNPILVTTFEYTVVSSFSELYYTAEVADGAPYPFSVTGPGFSDPVVPFGLDAFSSGRLTIPAPGVAGLVLVAGCAGMRRRR